jgi:hypothetical protein
MSAKITMLTKSRDQEETFAGIVSLVPLRAGIVTGPAALTVKH